MPHLSNIIREIQKSFRLGLDGRSKLRLASDVFFSRFLKFFTTPDYNQARSVTLTGGTALHYRMNRGDVQGIREVWMDECYALPEGVSPKTVVDLGGNIGLTSLWMHSKFKCRQIIVVEPNNENADLIERNLKANGINGAVLRAAVGPMDGEVSFANSEESNMGRVVSVGEQVESLKVRMVSMQTVLQELPENSRIDVLKLDIEGGEGPLFEGNMTWLDRVDMIVAELHPAVVDCERISQRLREVGFQFIPTGAYSSHSPSAFIRHDHPAYAAMRAAGLI